MHCDLCRQERPVARVELMMVIGLVIQMIHRKVDGFLCRDCLHTTFWKYEITTVLFGWWGIVSLFFTLGAIPGNLFNYAKGLMVLGEEERAARRPIGAPMSVKIDQIRQLAVLKEQGALSEAEYEQQKAQILNS